MLVLLIFILMFTNSMDTFRKNISSTQPIPLSLLHSQQIEHRQSEGKAINRITVITLLFMILLTYNTLYFQIIGKGISIYNGLFQITLQSQLVEIILLIVGVAILFSMCKVSPVSVLNIGREEYNQDLNFNTDNIHEKSIIVETESLTTLTGISDKEKQYSLIAIFSILGGSLLMSSLDLLSMYLSIELQSFSLYILATLNKESLSSTSAGLKYFLLGSLSSCFILLGAGIIYSYTGLTQFESISSLISLQSPADNFYLSFAPYNFNTVSEMTTAAQPLITDIIQGLNIGFVIMIVGFLFKISAAPFYQWAPDVYDGTPTIVTVWLTIVVKLTILIFLLSLFELILPFNVYPGLIHISPFTLNLGEGVANNTSVVKDWVKTMNGGGQELLLLSSFLSLLVGTIAGLSQTKIKRLLAFSSISHVGFLLLALGIFTQKSIDSFLFYLIQYSLTSLNIFLIVLAFGYYVIKTGVTESTNTSLNSRDKSESFIMIEENNIAAITPDQELKSLEESNQPLFPASLGIATQGVKGEQLLGQQKLGLRSKYTFMESKGANMLNTGPKDISYLIELKGQIYNNPVLSISLAICLFSMAGIPPLIGFFSKQFVLFSAIENGNYFLSITAILVSVISASYYLKLIKITFFELPGKGLEKVTLSSNSLTFNNDAIKGLTFVLISNLHSYLISILTFIILLFFLYPTILLNVTQLISLTVFNT